MRNISAISLIVLLLSIGIFSCRKIDKSFVTNVELINPEVNTMLVPHSKIIVLGKPEEIEKLNQVF